MFQKLIAWLTRHKEPFDKELADLAGINGYPAEIAALKRRAALNPPSGAEDHVRFSAAHRINDSSAV